MCTCILSRLELFAAQGSSLWQAQPDLDLLWLGCDVGARERIDTQHSLGVASLEVRQAQVV